MVLDRIYRKLDERYSSMVDVRRYLHMHPEPSFREVETARFIARFYKNLGMEVKTGVGGNGVVVRIRGAKPGKTVALRADFDALPIQDEKDVPYKSQVPGVMHACGHDGHTSVLLHLAQTLNEEKELLAGEYVIIHQPAEEIVPGGAKFMIEDGVLDGVDAIFGTHLWSTVPLGTLLYRSGTLMAAGDRFEITVIGEGGHGAHPEAAKDAIVCASQLVVQLQQIVSRRVPALSPAVVTIGRFVSDNSFNVIADKAFLEGTVRTFDEGIRDLIEREMERIIAGVCSSCGCRYEFRYEKGYPPVVNHPEETAFLTKWAPSVPGVERIEETEPFLIAEDFAYYLQKVKGTFFFTGAKSPEKREVYPHHHPKFDFDERAMRIAAKTLATLAIRYQSE
jgi:amidohydrolase